jgi:hypothetical protein
MEVVWTIKHMYPDVNDDNLEVVVYPDQSWKITKWNLPDTQPTNEEVEAYWNANQQTILDSNKPASSEIDTLKANQELIQKALDDLILGGAL